jgi:hypothetical protein
MAPNWIYISALLLDIFNFQKRMVLENKDLAKAGPVISINF